MGDFRDMRERDYYNMYIPEEEYEKAQAMVDGVRWARQEKEIRDLEALWLMEEVEPKRNLN